MCQGYFQMRVFLYQFRILKQSIPEKQVIFQSQTVGKAYIQMMFLPFSVLDRDRCPIGFLSESKSSGNTLIALAMIPDSFKNCRNILNPSLIEKDDVYVQDGLAKS